MIMNASRTLISRMAMRPGVAATASSRAFSNCEPVERIRGVFEEYRLQQ